jgi:hypothetical protein
MGARLRALGATDGSEMRWHFWFLSHRHLTRLPGKRPSRDARETPGAPTCIACRTVLAASAAAAYVLVFMPWLAMYLNDPDHEDTRTVDLDPAPWPSRRADVPARWRRVSVAGRAQVRCQTNGSVFYGSMVTLVLGLVGLVASVIIREVIDDFGIKVASTARHVCALPHSSAQREFRRTGWAFVLGMITYITLTFALPDRFYFLVRRAGPAAGAQSTPSAQRAARSANSTTPAQRTR